MLILYKYLKYGADSMSNIEISGRIKRGYLKSDFEFFHIKDKKSLEFEFHYHDFNKIIIFLSGNVTYQIEGKAYRLKPWDILFISSNDVHMPIIDPDTPYERIVIWINSRFLEMHNSDSCNLLTCFELSSRERLNLLRPSPEYIKFISSTLYQLEAAVSDKEFGSGILKNSLFMQLMVYFNRLFIRTDITKDIADIEYDERISDIIEYINTSLSENLTIEGIASKFYISKYHLMHRFKSLTGYTIHSYIQQKRLIYANTLIKTGCQITEACIKAGFGDYTSFVRTFKKTFGLSPNKYHKLIKELESSYNIKKQLQN